MRPNDIHPRSKLLREMRAHQAQHRRQMAQQERISAAWGNVLGQFNTAAPIQLGAQMFGSDARVTKLQSALTSAQRAAAAFGVGCVVLCLLLIAR